MNLKKLLGREEWTVLKLSRQVSVKIGESLTDFDWVMIRRKGRDKLEGQVYSFYYLILRLVMFNISRLLHTFAPKPNRLYPLTLQNEHPESLFARNSDSNEGNASDKVRGRVAQRKAKGKKTDERKNRDEDDNDNENGGFLEPILQDLQGFLQGKRRVAPAILSL